jgi:Tfp pilus assembly protein PilX
MQRRSRGNVLLVVLVCLVAISLLGAGILRLTGFTLSNARHRETGVGLSSCAQAIRQFVSASVKSGSTMTTDTYSFSIPGTNGQIKITPEHYDTSGGGPTLASDTFGASSAASGVENIGNVLPTRSFGQQKLHSGGTLCTDANGRVYEVEYSYVSAN